MKREPTIWDIIFRRPKLYDVTTKDRADWLDLFYDLLFVGILALMNTTFVYNFTLTGFLQFLVGFLAIWLIWVRNTLYSARTRMNDTFHRLFMLVKMGTIMFVGVSAISLTTHAYLFILAYISGHCLQLFIYWFTALTNKHIKRLVKQMSLVYSIWILLMSGCYFLPPFWRELAWITLLLIELAIPWMILEEHHHESSIHTPFLNERFGLFTLLVLAELLISALLNMQVHTLNFDNFLLSFLNLGYVFAIWWVYFDQVSHRRLHQSALHIQWWMQGHLVFFFLLSLQGIYLRLIMLNNLNALANNRFFLLLLAGLFFTIAFLKKLMTYGSMTPFINVFWKHHYDELIWVNVALGFVALILMPWSRSVSFQVVLLVSTGLLLCSIVYAMKLWAQGILYAKKEATRPDLS